MVINKKIKYINKNSLKKDWDITKKKFKILDDKNICDIKNSFETSTLTINKLLYCSHEIDIKIKNIFKDRCDHRFNELSSFDSCVKCVKCEKKMLKNFYERKKEIDKINCKQISRLLELNEDLYTLNSLVDTIKNNLIDNQKSIISNIQSICDHEWGEIQREYEPCGPSVRWKSCKICRKVVDL